MNTSLFFLLLTLFSLSYSHICLLHPVQRGGINSTLTPGDHRCFWPSVSECNKPIATPQVVFYSGRSHAITLQQNLNHYNPGHPGYLDVAISNGVNQTDDSQFTVLRHIPDFYAHFQGTQTNITLTISIPENFQCDHCTLRVRYHPNKPTEPVFHNCADIKIENPPLSPETGRLFGFRSESRFSGSGKLVEMSHDGKVSVKNDLMGFPSAFLADSVVASHLNSQSLYFLGGETKEVYEEDPPAPKTIYRYSVENNSITQIGDIPLGEGQVNAIVRNHNPHADPPFYLVQQITNGKNGFSFAVLGMDVNGKITKKYGETSFDSQYVNFLWADAYEDRMYILAGDENSLYELNAVLYTIYFEMGDIESVNVDHSKYTLSSFSVDQSTGILYAPSPGLVKVDESKRVWSLVTIDPTNGNVKLIDDISNEGEFMLDFGGSVHEGFTQNGVFYHIFKKSNGVSTLVGVNPSRAPNDFVVYENDLDLGTNEMDRISTVVYLQPA